MPSSIRDGIIKDELMIVNAIYFSNNITIYIKIFIKRSLFSENYGYSTALGTYLLQPFRENISRAFVLKLIKGNERFISGLSVIVGIKLIFF
jgi:hypothetical protein